MWYDHVRAVGEATDTRHSGSSGRCERHGRGQGATSPPGPELGTMTDDRNNGADTEPERKPGTFRPGNPGRRPGARNKATLAALALLEGEAEAVTRKAVELALGGDTVALKLVLDRLLPKGRTVKIDLPMRTLGDL